MLPQVPRDKICLYPITQVRLRRNRPNVIMKRIPSSLNKNHVANAISIGAADEEFDIRRERAVYVLRTDQITMRRKPANPVYVCSHKRHYLGLA
jgi:hypothetical protein